MAKPTKEVVVEHRYFDALLNAEMGGEVNFESVEGLVDRAVYSAGLAQITFERLLEGMPVKDGYVQVYLTQEDRELLCFAIDRAQTDAKLVQRGYELLSEAHRKEASIRVKPKAA